MHAPRTRRPDAKHPKGRHDTTCQHGLRTRTVLTAAALIFFAANSAFAAPSAAELARKVDQLAADELATGPTAGISILVAHKGKVLLAKGYGYADVDKREPATEHTVYRLGSLSKQFTAVAVLELVDQGLIRLDESIRTYLPGYPEVGQPITPRHLLNHTSGLVSYTAQSEYWKHMNDDLPHSTVLGWFASRDLAYTPGDRYVYSNSGYFVLGLIIEQVTGESYAEYVQREILDPLKLRETYYDDGKKSVSNRALGYARDEKKIVPARELNMNLAYSVGGMASSVLDIYALHTALRAGKLITPESYAIMTSPAWLNNGDFSKYGMGFHVDTWDGLHVLRHGGLVFGFKTCYYYYPKQDLTVIILMNTEEAQYRPIQSAIARMFIPDLPAAIDYE